MSEHPRGRRPCDAPEGDPEKEESGSSEDSKKGKKRKRKRKAFRMEPKNPYDSLFKNSGLDKDPKIRRKVARIAKRAMKRKGRGSTSSGSSGASTEEEDYIQDGHKSFQLEMGEITEGEVAVNAIALRFYCQVLRERMSPV